MLVPKKWIYFLIVKEAKRERERERERKRSVGEDRERVERVR